MTETLMETNLPDKISTMSVDDMMKLTGQSADAPTTSKGLSRLSINHSAEDEEGNVFGERRELRRRELSGRASSRDARASEPHGARAFRRRACSFPAGIDPGSRRRGRRAFRGRPLFARAREDGFENRSFRAGPRPRGVRRRPFRFRADETKKRFRRATFN